MTAPPPPTVNRLVIEALLDTYASSLRKRRLMLVHGTYPDNAAAVFTAKIGGETRRVHVSRQNSVLGIVDAWHRHRADVSRESDLLVVTSDVPDQQLGWDVRGQAVHQHTLTVENAEIVKQRFGVKDLDPRLYRETWLLKALLDAEPVEGWPRTGAVLTRDAAVRALLAARLGLGGGGADKAGGDTAIDTDTLLAWSRTAAGPARFAELDARERHELVTWLGETAGPAAPVLLSLVESGRGADAMARGLLGTTLADPSTGPEAWLAVGGLFGTGRGTEDVLVFAHAVAGTLTRWVGEAPHNDAARQRVLAVVDRADRLAQEAGLTQALRGNRFLPSSFTAQLHRFCAALTESSAAAESALAELRDHSLAVLHGDRLAAADMAVRLARWLETPAPAVGSVPQAVSGHLADWGWADRAVNALWAGDPAGDPVAGQAYRSLYEAARARRDHLDEAFAARLAPWARTADQDHPGGALVVENILTDAALPLLGEDTAPLVVLLDGMSSAAAVQIGEEAERNGWIEAVPVRGKGVAGAEAGAAGAGVAGAGAAWPDAAGAGAAWPDAGGPVPGAGALVSEARLSGARLSGARDRVSEGGGPVRRLAAVSMLPSVTRISRTSLLCGQAAVGGQAVEQAGFAAFWKRHRRPAELFHKAAIGGSSGQRLTEELVTALASPAVVGVVLNTIDDALDHGQEGERTQWRTGDVTFLPELLAAARSYRRPVLLVADHGHVLDRGTTAATRTPGAGSARWRTGTPAEGEVQLTGPRVREGDGTIVAPWREDIRYTARKAGYHGGAALAEVTVPLLVLLPEADLLPKGWQVLPREDMAPGWWHGPRAVAGDASAGGGEGFGAGGGEFGGATGSGPGHATGSGPGGVARIAEAPPRRKPRKSPQPGADGLFAETDVQGPPAGAPAGAPTGPGTGPGTGSRTGAPAGFPAGPGDPAAPTPPEPAGKPLTLGARVVAGDVFLAQKVYVRKGPTPEEVAAVIDALADAGETLSLAALAAAVSAPARVRRTMDGFIATLQRLLNVEGYAVLTLIDSGRTARLDVRLLRTQFQLEGDPT